MLRLFAIGKPSEPNALASGERNTLLRHQRLATAIRTQGMSARSLRRGLSLIELLMVIAIISLLIQLALPAIEMSREAARRSQCANNLRQLGLAMSLHESEQGHWPTGGWNWEWIGDPSRGAGLAQPGGWVFNVLPFLEEDSLHKLSLHTDEDERSRLATEMQLKAPRGFNCPSRRRAKPYSRDLLREPGLRNAVPAALQTRSDYAANGGDRYVNLGPAPKSFRHEASGRYQWPAHITRATGVCFVRSLIRPVQITDGLSKTYLIGEKYLNRKHYKDGKDLGDDSTMFQGDDMDITRWTSPTVVDKFHRFKDLPNLPRRDGDESVAPYAFGSAHPQGWQAVLCDGSVHVLDYDMDAEVHRRLGNRHDGQSVAF